MTAHPDRTQMVERQLLARGIGDLRVLRAFMDVPREMFLPQAVQQWAFEDFALPLGKGQTISQPYVVALTAEALKLKGGEHVLEVGTGWGYAAAILSRLCRQVHSIERHTSLAARARKNLKAAGVDNVEVICADGTVGWGEFAPYDAIAVAAASPDVPAALRRQLALGGRLVIPVGSLHEQRLVRLTRTGADEFEEEVLTDVRFVPLVGRFGWSEGDAAAPKSQPNAAP